MYFGVIHEEDGDFLKRMENKMILDILGWLGTVMIIIAFFCNTSQLLKSTSLTYQLFNIVGSIFLGASLFQKQAWSGVALQTVWILIALFGVWKNKKK